MAEMIQEYTTENHNYNKSSHFDLQENSEMFSS